jgi:hypothetical protein
MEIADFSHCVGFSKTRANDRPVTTGGNKITKSP